MEVPALGEYLDRRIITCPHLITKGLTKAGIKKSMKTSYWKREGDDVSEVFFGSMVADVWQDKQKVKEKMYDE